VLLSYDAKACKTSVVNYTIACFNGKFAWVPFTQDISKIALAIEQDP